MKSKNGKVCLEDISSNICEIDYCYDDRLKSFFDNQKKYYVKSIHRGSKEESAEVLLSRIYQKAGFDCATYIPAYSKYDDNTYVISNNIKTKSSCLARDFNRPFIKVDGVAKNYFVNNSCGLKVEGTKFFTFDTIRQIIKMRLFDAAFFNIDRNNTNYFYNVEKNVATRIQLFDNAMSANYKDIIGSNCDYCHDFCASSSTQNGLLEFLKESDSVSHFISPKEMAEELASVDVKATREEIGDQTGFSVDRQYCKALTDSVNYCIETLDK